jgi:hypothetical protein
MDNAIVIKGRLTGPRNVELDEPVSQMTERVEVILHPIESEANGRSNAGKVVEFLRSLPAGTRSRDDIDRQLRDERDNWDRGEDATS